MVFKHYRVPFFLQRGRVDVRLRNASKSRSEACTHCAQSVRDTPHRFCGLPRLKTARKRRPKKCPYTDYPIMCGILRGIPRSLLRFYKPPDFVHMCTRFCTPGRPVYPFLFMWKRTSCRAPAWKIPHVSGKLPTLMQPQHGRITDDRKDPPRHRRGSCRCIRHYEN